MIRAGSTATDEERFQAVIDDLRTKYQSLDVESVMLQGCYPGRAIEFSDREGRLFSLRVYVANGRIYQTIVTTSSDTRDDASVLRFHESFRVLSPAPADVAERDSTVRPQPQPPQTEAQTAVDLLQLVDLARDARGGNWTREGSSLVCPEGSRWALAVGQPPAKTYRWTIVIERLSGYGTFSFCLLVDGRQTMVVLEGYGRQLSGLGLVDGRTADANETTWRGTLFEQGKPSTIVCTVDSSTVAVACDGKSIIKWTGSAERLSLDRRVWPELPGDQLLVASYQGVSVRISKMEVVAVAADAAAAQPPVADQPPSGDIAENRPRPPGPRRPPWGRGPPFDRSSYKSTSSSEAEQRSPFSQNASAPVPVIRLEDLPAPVARSKESVCIIEHPLGSGTGFVVAENIVATNAHVVDGAYVEEIECNFSSSGELKCRAKRVLFEDPVRDLCLLEVDTNQPTVPIVSDHAFKRGENVVIVGNPALGETDVVLRDAVMGGTINAMVHINNCDFYQIDAAVNCGGSGGPVMNLDGEVVAVIAMKATDQGETEIRSALRKLDDNFANRFRTAGRKGIAFGIPVNALTRAIDEVKGQPESAIIRAGDRHIAKAALERMSVLSGFYLLQMQVNVPLGVRQQAANIKLRRIPATTLSKMKLVPLMPERLAGLLARELESDEVHKMVRVSETGLDAKVKHVRESEHFDQLAAQNLQKLYQTVQGTKAYAEEPPGTYQAFSQAVSRQEEQLKTLIRGLKDRLEVTKAAYDD